MDRSFEDIKQIIDRINSGEAITRPDFHDQIIKILERHGIGIRRDDGVDPVVTISYPVSVSGGIVVGLRYTKKDSTKTEDHFLFQPGTTIERCYGKRLEKLMLEYKGAHKLQR